MQVELNSTEIRNIIRALTSKKTELINAAQNVVRTTGNQIDPNFETECLSKANELNDIVNKLWDVYCN